MGNKTSKSPKTVAVCGATGQQGGATVEALLKLGGFHIRALTRNPAAPKAAALGAKGVEVVKAEFDDLASLKAAFEGCDAVFAVTDFWVACQLDPFRELQQGKNLVDAAKASGVKFFVFSSLEDPRPLVGDLIQPVNGPYKVPHFEAKAEIDVYMRQQLPGKCCSLITSIFYENVLPGGGMAPAKQPDGSFALFMCTGDASLAWCTTEDIGSVAAQVIKDGPRKWGGKTVGVAGEHLSCAEFAEVIKKVTGVNVNGVCVPADAWVGAVTSFGLPEVAARDLANMMVYYDKVGMLKLRPLEQTKAIFPGVQGLEGWVEKNKAAFLEGLK